MTHTPGPWVVGGRPNRDGDRTDAIGVNADGGHGYTVCDVFGDVEELAPHMRANAHLIAAAPDLLAALKEAEEMIGGEFPRSWPIHSKIAAAIAKAEETA
jgi:hypothetical protein